MKNLVRLLTLSLLFAGAQSKKKVELDIGVASFMKDGVMLPGDHRKPKSKPKEDGASNLDEEDMTIDVKDAMDVQIFAKMYVGSN